jgi:hypothetical protein
VREHERAGVIEESHKAQVTRHNAATGRFSVSVLGVL